MIIIDSIKKYSQVWYIGYSVQGGIGLGLAPIFLPIIVAMHTNNMTKAGTIVAIFYFSQVLAPFWGWLADRTNKHRIIFISSYIMVGLGIGLFPLISNMFNWIVSSFLLGLGIGCANTLSEMFIVEFQPKLEWDSRVSTLQTFFGVGQALGLFLAFFLSKDASLALYLSAILMFPSMLIGIIQLPSLQNRKQQSREDKHLKPSMARHFGSLLKHLENIRFYRFRFPTRIITPFSTYLAAWILIMLGNWLIYNLYPLLMSNVFDMSTSSSSLFFAIGSTIAIVACPISGWLTIKVGEYFVMKLGIFMSLISASGLLSISLLNLSQLSWLAATAFIFLPIAWSPLIIIGTSLTSKISNLKQGEALGIFTSITALASMIAAITAGLLADYFGFTAVLIVSTIAIMLGLFMMSALFKKLNQE